MTRPTGEMGPFEADRPGCTPSPFTLDDRGDHT